MNPDCSHPSRPAAELDTDDAGIDTDFTCLETEAVDSACSENRTLYSPYKHSRPDGGNRPGSQDHRAAPRMFAWRAASGGTTP